MAGTKRKIPTEEEISKLPRWAIVAFAARCARQVQPLFELAWPDAPKEHKEAVAKAIEFTEVTARRGESPPPAVTAAHTAVTAAHTAATAAHTAATAANAAANAAHAAANAANAANAAHVNAANADIADAADIAGHANAAHAAAIGHAAAAIGHAAAAGHAYAAYAAIANAKSECTDCIRADFVKLKQAAKKENWTDKTPVPPEFFGPMWPHGEPDWLAGIARGKLKSHDREPMSLYFDREEFSNREIAEIISMLSELYHGVSRDRLVIDKTMQFTPVGELVPEGV